jgi:hypothetical protein
MKISTKTSEANIKKILTILAASPGRLQALSEPRSALELNAPLKQDHWSFAKVMAHLYAYAELINHATYYALLFENPTLPNVHPQQNWARLVRYDQFAFSSLLASFVFQREVLLHKLTGLNDTQWARLVTREGKRQETIYRLNRSMALHEIDHLAQLEAILL